MHIKSNIHTIKLIVKIHWKITLKVKMAKRKKEEDKRIGIGKKREKSLKLMEVQDRYVDK